MCLLIHYADDKRCFMVNIAIEIGIETTMRTIKEDLFDIFIGNLVPKCPDNFIDFYRKKEAFYLYITPEYAKKRLINLVYSYEDIGFDIQMSIKFKDKYDLILKPAYDIGTNYAS